MASQGLPRPGGFSAEAAAPEFSIARVTVDFLRPVPIDLLRVRLAPLREGATVQRRIARLLHGDTAVAHTVLVLVRAHTVPVTPLAERPASVDLARRRLAPGLLEPGDNGEVAPVIDAVEHTNNVPSRHFRAHAPRRHKYPRAVAKRPRASVAPVAPSAASAHNRRHTEDRP